MRARLSAMMFLQFAIWGAWAPVLYSHLTDPAGLALDPNQAAAIFGTLWIGCIVAPWAGGQIADRWMPTQWFLAAAHLAGGATLIAAALAKGYGPLFWAMLLYAMLYAPTLALTSSLAFRHLEDREKGFGAVRVFGTLGWIAAGLALSGLRAAWPALGIGRSDALLLAGALSIVTGVYCATLPDTPPAREGTRPLAFLETLKLLRQPELAFFLAISFVVTTELQFYYLPTSSFLQDLGVAPARVPAVMTVAQIAEVAAMWLALPRLLPRIGIRRALAIGVVAWPLRYLVFALGRPLWLVIASLALHGIGYTFFFVVSQIYVDGVAPKDVRASAQALLTFATLGIGNWLGTAFTGAVLTHYRSGTSEAWGRVFLVPCALTFACAAAFLLGFRPRPLASAVSQTDHA